MTSTEFIRLPWCGSIFMIQYTYVPSKKDDTSAGLHAKSLQLDDLPF
jgi:hypothetical protein